MSNTNNATDGADLATNLLATAKGEAEEVVKTDNAETAEELSTDDKTEEKPEVEVEPEVEPEEKEEELEEVEETEEESKEELNEVAAKWKAMSRKNETKLRASLTKNQELEKKVQALELEKVKYEIAIAKGFGADDLILLDGSTKEAIEAKADALVKRFGATKPASGFGQNPLQGFGGRSETPLDKTPEGLIGNMLADFGN